MIDQLKPLTRSVAKEVLLKAFDKDFQGKCETNFYKKLKTALSNAFLIKSDPANINSAKSTPSAPHTGNKSGVSTLQNTPIAGILQKRKTREEDIIDIKVDFTIEDLLDSSKEHIENPETLSNPQKRLKVEEAVASVNNVSFEAIV